MLATSRIIAILALLKYLTSLTKSMITLSQGQNCQFYVKIANIQKTCAAVGSNIAYMQVMLSKNQNETDLDFPQIIRNLVHPGALIGHVNTDLLFLRRDTMRPTLHEDYRNLCNPDLPITSLLLGDDLQKGMKDLKETSKIGNRVTNSQRGYNRSRSPQIFN